jgi:O-antigen ligase
MTSSIAQKALQTLVNRPGKVWEDFLLITAISLYPLLYLTYRGWTNRWLVALFILALVFSLTHWRYIKSEFNDRSSQLITLTLASPFLAILFSQLLRNDININAYDGPLRFFLAGLIFLYLKYKQIDFLKVFQYIAPISLLIAVGAIFYYPETSAYWGGRYASYFVDPLTFGGYALVIGFTCLFQLNIQKDSYVLSALKLIGFACALFLSLGSGSRSGWMAIPFVLALWIFFNRRNHKLVISASLILIIAIALTLTLNDSLQQRVMSIFQEAHSWFTNQANKEEGSGGMRLTMWKMSWVLFLESPWYGYGDPIGYKHLLDQPLLTSFAGPNALGAITLGPHHEIFGQMLRSGIFGLVAGLLLFFAPMGVFIQQLRNNSQNLAAQVGLAFVLGLFICSLSIEVFNLKYTSSFYALMLACLGAQALSLNQRSAS